MAPFLATSLRFAADSAIAQLDVTALAATQINVNT
jgi:hypothetical protein